MSWMIWSRPSEPSSDESLAAMWEQSLQDDSDDEESFDLSDEFSSASRAGELTPEQEIEDGLLDQSILDDLLSEVEAENQLEEDPAFTADPFAGEEKSSPPLAEQSAQDPELDALFDSAADDVRAPDTAGTEAESKTQQAAVDQALAEADAIMAAESQALEEDELEALFDQNSTALLDELLEEDDLSSDIEIEENSTALLDELLDDDSSLLNTEVSIDENSTALLDELVDGLDSQAGLDDEGAGTAELDDEAPLSVDDIVIGEGSTELLDDILAQHSEQPEEHEFEAGQDAADRSLPADDTSADADFPEPEQSAFDDIFSEALEEQSSQEDVAPAVAQEPEEEAVTEQPGQALHNEPEEPVAGGRYRCLAG